MPRDINLNCKCGQVQLCLHKITPERGTHITCYCKDCRAFSAHLGAADMIGPHGEAHIFQTRPDRVTIAKGADHLAALRLGPKGIVRWYAQCCNTPMANTLATPNVPFVGVLTDRAEDPSVFGPFRVQGFTASAVNPPEGLTDSGLPLLMTRFIRRAIAAWVTGKAKQNAFFQNGELLVEPTVLTREQRAAATS